MPYYDIKGVFSIVYYFKTSSEQDRRAALANQQWCARTAEELTLLLNPDPFSADNFNLKITHDGNKPVVYLHRGDKKAFIHQELLMDLTPENAKDRLEYLCSVITLY